MHADFHELSEVASGRGTVQHGLRALAPLAPPASAWAGVQTRLERRAEARALAPTPAAYAMAASLLVIALTALLFTGRPQGSPGLPQVEAAAVPVDGLVAQNAQLEAYLAGLPQPRTTRVGTAYTVAAIEDRLAFLDDRITAAALEPNAPEVAEDLWRERLTLMNSLVRVHYANALASR